MRIEGIIPTIIDNLYAGALDDAAWSRGMIGVSDLVGASGGHLMNLDLATNRVIRDEAHRTDPALISAYRTYWSTHDPLVLPALGLKVGQPTVDGQLVDVARWRRSEIFNEFAIPFDVPHVLATILYKSPHKLVALSLKATFRHGAFERHEADSLIAVIPHIRRALEIKDRLEAANVTANSLAASFGNLSFGVIILDASGRMTEASTVAAAMMRAPDSGISQCVDKRLSLPAPAGPLLYQWIIAGTLPPTNADGLLRIARSSKQPLSILVSALPENMRSWIAGGPRWVLFLFDPEWRTQVSIQLIAHDLSISEREAEIAALLVAGYDLKGVADRLNISIHTARTHLKTVFEKTGLRSQAELVHRIAKGPASVGPAGRRSP
jgi:DNA-binding CsgD family transcriptional regulator